MTRLAVFVGLLLLSVPATAAEISPEIQVQLQAATQQHIDQVSAEGAYTYIDHKSEDLKTVYPAKRAPYGAAIR
jgi:ribonucleotide reductase alpha subunit